MNEIPFTTAQRMISHMTADSWKCIPHLTYQYVPDVTDFMEQYHILRDSNSDWKDITINSLFMWVCAQGLKAAPKCNSWLEYEEASLNGCLHIKSGIDATMPVLFPNGMLPLTITGMEVKTVPQLHRQITELCKKARDEDLITYLQQLPKDTDLRSYLTESNDSMLGTYLPAGTVTISNVGSLYSGSPAYPGGLSCLASMNLVAPQVFIIGINAVQKQAAVYTDVHGKTQVGPRDLLPFTLTFDHRAINFSDVLPFIERLDELFAHPKEAFSLT